MKALPRPITPIRTNFAPTPKKPEVSIVAVLLVVGPPLWLVRSLLAAHWTFKRDGQVHYVESGLFFLVALAVLVLVTMLCLWRRTPRQHSEIAVAVGIGYATGFVVEMACVVLSWRGRVLPHEEGWVARSVWYAGAILAVVAVLAARFAPRSRARGVLAILVFTTAALVVVGGSAWSLYRLEQRADDETGVTLPARTTSTTAAATTTVTTTTEAITTTTTTIAPFDPGAGNWALFPTVDKPDLERGETGDAVRYLQGVLRAKAGNPDLEITGEYDRATEKAVKALQQFFKLKVTGKVTAAEWAVIDQLVKP